MIISGRDCGLVYQLKFLEEYSFWLTCTRIRKPESMEDCREPPLLWLLLLSGELVFELGELFDGVQPMLLNVYIFNFHFMLNFKITYSHRKTNFTYMGCYSDSFSANH